ncbi:MAG: hypothetical protein EXR05_04660 [Acetobacteraceae bacterium]|nr:hypothetical protein [Acetobacteraceae bacterium]
MKDIRRATSRHFLAENKIRIVPEGLCSGQGRPPLAAAHPLWCYCRPQAQAARVSPLRPRGAYLF